MRRVIAVLFLLAIVACNQPFNSNGNNTAVGAKAVRYGMVTGIKPDKIAYYKQLHAKPWPQVLATIKASNIQNYSIYLQQIGEQYFLFSYFEYVGHDFEADMKKMAADSMTRKWWKETDPCQLPLPEALEKHMVWTSMPEVFHAD